VNADTILTSLEAGRPMQHPLIGAHLMGDLRTEFEGEL